MQKELKNSGLVFIFSSIFIFLVYEAIYRSELNIKGKFWGINYNLATYIIAFLVGFGFFLFFSLILKFAYAYIRKTILLCCYLLCSVVSGFFLYMVYDKEGEYSFAGDGWTSCFLREKYEHLYVLIFMISVFSIFYFLFCKNPVFNKKIKSLFVFLLAIIGGSFSYAPNIYKNEMWGIYHIHAYTNSIVNVANFFPYSDAATSIYGHYGLIYLPFVKLLGDDSNAIAITIAFFSFLTFLSAGYVVSKVIKNDFLSLTVIAGIIGTSTTFFSKGEYFQVMPHRCLFPMIVLAYIAWSSEKSLCSRRRTLDIFLIGIFAIVFNLETGVVCSITLISAYFFALEKKNIKSWIFMFVKCILYVLLCFLCAYCICNIYNLLVGGDWNNIKTFIYPLKSSDYDMSFLLRTQITNPIGGYILHIIAFFVTIYTILIKAFKDKNGLLDSKNVIILSTAISGMGCLAYFINRCAASCLSVSHIQFIVILGVFADINKKISFKNIFNKNDNPENVFIFLFSFLALFLISWFSIEGVISINNITINRASSVWNTESLNEDIMNFNGWNKEGVIAMGTGVPEFYYAQGMSTGIALTDWSGDMNHYSYELVEEISKTNEELIINVDLLNYEYFNEYEIVDSFDGNNIHLVYLKK